MEVDVRSAVESAQQYLRSLQDVVVGETVKDLRLEEVELSEDRKFWLITLGFNTPAAKKKKPLADLIDYPQTEREYKVFKVNAETGTVESMKIRTL